MNRWKSLPRRVWRTTRVRVPIRLSLGILLILGALRLPSPGQQQPAPPRKVRLEIIFSGSLFHSVNRNDAIAAVRV